MLPDSPGLELISRPENGMAIRTIRRSVSLRSYEHWKSLMRASAFILSFFVFGKENITRLNYV